MLNELYAIRSNKCKKSAWKFRICFYREERITIPTHPKGFVKSWLLIYYSKFAKDQLFDIAHFSPIANDTHVQGPYYCVLKLSICHVQLALIILISFKSTFIFITNTQK